MTLLYPKADTHWIALSDRTPDPDEHWRVLVYTEGYDFGGEQVFDVESEKLNENWYIALAQGREPHRGEASPGATGSTTPGNHGEKA